MLGLPRFLATFLLAMVAGALSNVPGGIGVFESAMILLLPQVPVSTLLGAILAYRILYFLLPLGIALALIASLIQFNSLVQGWATDSSRIVRYDNSHLRWLQGDPIQMSPVAFALRHPLALSLVLISACTLVFALVYRTALTDFVKFQWWRHYDDSAFRSGYVEHGGASLYYESHGSGSTMLLLHGGIIGLILALRKPQRAHSLFAMETNFRASGLTEETRLAIAEGLPARESLFSKALYALYSPHPRRWQQLWQRLKHLWLNGPNLHNAELASIEQKVWIVVGEHDNVSLAHSKEMAAALANSRFVLIPNAGHNLLIEKPTAMRELMMDFVS